MPNAPEPVGDVHPLIARLIQPDPNDPLRVALVAASPDDTMESAASRLCIFDVEGSSMSGTCLPFHDVFEQGPFTLGLQGSGPSQYSLLSGLASDDVAAMKVFLGSGATIDVALADNVYAARVARSEFPIRLAAYDSYGSVVGVHAYSDDGMISRAPAEARRSVRELMRVHGEGAGVAVVRAGIPAGGFRCWSIDFTGGAGGGGCTPWPYRGPVLGVAVTNAAGDAFLTGQASAKVASIEAELPDGGEVTIRPREGLVAYAVPAGQRFVALRALDADGNELATRGFRVTAPTRP
jgi:hypothetical protein